MKNYLQFILIKLQISTFLLSILVFQNIFYSILVFSETKTSIASGNWNTDATWNSAGVPVVGVEIEVIPDRFSLSQNYPNPFNPSTTTKYSIPGVETGHAPSLLIMLKVYDILGNEVATLVNEEKPAGTYEVKWSATALSSGVYFYQLKARSFVETKKMILLR